MIRQDVSSLIRWFSWMRFHFDREKNVAVPAVILFRSILIVAAKISVSGHSVPTNIAFPPLPTLLLTTFNND